MMTYFSFMSIMFEPEFKNYPLCGDGFVKEYGITSVKTKTLYTLIRDKGIKKEIKKIWRCITGFYNVNR